MNWTWLCHDTPKKFEGTYVTLLIIHGKLMVSFTITLSGGETCRSFPFVFTSFIVDSSNKQIITISFEILPKNTCRNRIPIELLMIRTWFISFHHKYVCFLSQVVGGSTFSTGSTPVNDMVIDCVYIKTVKYNEINDKTWLTTTSYQWKSINMHVKQWMEIRNITNTVNKHHH